MNRTENIVRNMLAAIEAPSYDVGVLNDKGMLPGLDNIPAAEVLDKLSHLKYRNARGSHIYIRPSGEHRYTVLDDLDEASLAKLSADGFDPCAIVETSTGNFQAWLQHQTVFPKLMGTFAAQTLAQRYGADPSAADWSSQQSRWLITAVRPRPAPARLSAGWEHINLTGDYTWHTDKGVAKGGFRPLRSPRNPSGAP